MVREYLMLEVKAIFPKCCQFALKKSGIAEVSNHHILWFKTTTGLIALISKKEW